CSANGGTNTVTLTVTDNNHNVATCNATVTVVDSTIPDAKCKPYTLVLDVPAFPTRRSSDLDDGSSDACGIKSMTVSPNTFTCANVGRNTVTSTVTVDNNNVATCTATVTVVDSTIPDAKCKPYTLVLDGTGNGSITPANVGDG